MTTPKRAKRARPRPLPDDPPPVQAKRFGAVVLVTTTNWVEVLTPTEARDLAAVLLAEAEKADATPWADTGSNRTRQIPR